MAYYPFDINKELALKEQDFPLIEKRKVHDLFSLIYLKFECKKYISSFAVLYRIIGMCIYLLSTEILTVCANFVVRILVRRLYVKVMNSMG